MVEKAGADLNFRGAVMYAMCDWGAVCSILGAPAWSRKKHPCPLCSASSLDWHRRRWRFLSGE
eukprot:5276176-Pyramimonas_sp.AAC.1